MEKSRKIVGLRTNSYSYFIGDVIECKKAKGTKKGGMKRKLKFENYKNCLEASQHENKINHLERNKTDVDNLKEDHKEFVRNNRLILKTHQRFRYENHNVFTEEITKIALSLSDDKVTQSIDSKEAYACKTCKDLIADILSNKKLNPTVFELLIRGRKPKVSFFIMQSYFAAPKNVTLNSAYYFIMKIPNKRVFQEIAFNHSSDIEECMEKPYYLYAIDPTLESDNP